ncbi:MAG: glutamine-hydrolyzing carbamoyl-phosphate synthase small subunit [Alphaproteobacteria bacterium]|nr:glutamine-hydrolyzing carbamoyl-phosphate synthase small subunit [Alphaproteobacteria bacterium]
MAHSPACPSTLNAALVLADGSVFFGHGIGEKGVTAGEICFNTGLTGYQEILTDPSYAGQIITFTFPHIGNVGANKEDTESREVFARGLIIREPITEPSNFRSASHLNDWLVKHKITGICGIDTRRLTRHIRDHGAQNAVIQFAASPDKIDVAALVQKAQAHPSLKGLDLAKEVTVTKAYEWKEPLWSLTKSKAPKPLYNVVAIDYGEKLNILRCLVSAGCRVTVVPASTSAKDILKHKPDGIFLSNGPGDPAATGQYAIPVLKELLDSGIPVFGICLGHQLLALALGAKTEKMHRGHRGANHPVQDLETDKVEITSQNHGFCVVRESLPKGVIETHRSLFDGSLEGIKVKGKPVFSVQYHPEASPGPHDSHYLFERFVKAMESTKKKKAKRHAT